MSLNFFRHLFMNKTFEETKMGTDFKCTHRGEFELAGRIVSCAVLSNGERIITRSSLFDIFDKPRKGEKRNGNLLSIIGAKNLLPYVDDELKKLAEPIYYYSDSGAIKAGYNALLIPAICNLYINASSVMMKSQEKILSRAKEILKNLDSKKTRLLIDNASRYSLEQEAIKFKQALDQFLPNDFSKWHIWFPQDFYKELYRLNVQKEECIGLFITKYVYEALPDSLIKDLRNKNPKNAHGSKKSNYLFSGDIGIPHLEKHITKLITVMELSKSMDEFIENFELVFHKKTFDIPLLDNHISKIVNIMKKS